MKLLKTLFCSIFLTAALTMALHAEEQASTQPVTVVITTSKGDITLELYPDKAPLSVENFLQYVEDDFYAGTIFHRVIDGFMIQGGGFSPEMRKKPTRGPIKNEASNGLKNDRGTIAMARTANPNSATAQFYINLVDNSPLNYSSARNPGYAVFGKVTSGMAVVDKMAKVATGSKGHYQNVPKETILIEKVVVKKAE